MRRRNRRCNRKDDRVAVGVVGMWESARRFPRGCGWPGVGDPQPGISTTLSSAVVRGDRGTPSLTPVQQGALCAPSTMRVAISKSKSNSQTERVRRTLPHSLKAHPQGECAQPLDPLTVQYLRERNQASVSKLRSYCRAPNLPHMGMLFHPQKQITVAMNEHARADNPRT